MSRILTLAGKRWLAGMNWRTYDKPPARALVRAEARALGANVFVQRSGTIRTVMGVEPRYDVGYATIGKETSRSTIYALGAALSNAKPGPWEGIFKLNDNLFYYLAIDSNGAIIPDQYGELVGTSAEVELARAAHAALREAARVEGDLKTLEELIQAFPGPYLGIQFVTRKIRLKPFHAVPILTLTAITVGVVELYLWHEARLEQQAQQAQFTVFMRQKLATPPESPLEKILAPGQWLPLCNPARWSLPAVENGWVLHQYECSPKSVVLTWVRGEGATAGLRPPGALNSGGNVIVQILPLHAASISMRKRSESKPPAFSAGRERLEAWAQRVGFSIEFGVQSQVVGFGWKQSAITIESPLVPWDLTSLDEIKGLRMTSFNSTPSGEWILKGTLYGS